MDLAAPPDELRHLHHEYGGQSYSSATGRRVAGPALRVVAWHDIGRIVKDDALPRALLRHHAPPEPR